MSEGPTQRQGEPTEAMVEAAARAIRVSLENSEHDFSEAGTEAVYRDAARVALIAGIAAALKASDS